MIEGKTISKKCWEEAIAKLTFTALNVASEMKRAAPLGLGEGVSELYMDDMALALQAMRYVAEFATDKVTYEPLDQADVDLAVEKLKEMGLLNE